MPGKDLSACSDEELAAEMAAFYNAVETRLQQNIQQFNWEYLDMLMDDLEGCGYPFWEYPKLLNPAFMQAHPDFDPEDSYCIEELPEPAFIPPNAVETEIAVRKAYPMFDFEYYLSHLTLHCLEVSTYITEGWITFEISDDMDYLCHLTANIKPDFSLYNWNNG